MDPNHLAERYSSMQTEELVSLYSAGTLIDDAYPILEAELARRSIVAGPRPNPPLIEKEPPFFSGHWSGRHPAGSANAYVAVWVPWLLGFAFWLIYKVVRYIAPESSLAAALQPTYAIAGVAYLVFATVAVWRCARNEISANSIGWARFKGLKSIAIYALIAVVVIDQM